MSALTTVESPQLTLAPGQSTYDVDQAGWEAQCPTGDYVFGTGFDEGGIGQVGFVTGYSTFVGGFISNPASNAIPITVSIEAICGKAGGSSGTYAVRRGSPTGEYQTNLRRAEAAVRSRTLPRVTLKTS